MDVITSRHDHHNEEAAPNVDWSDLSTLLLGRNQVSSKLVNSYKRCFTSTTKANGLVMITGPSGGKFILECLSVHYTKHILLVLLKHQSHFYGICDWKAGKTSLAMSLQDEVVQDGGFFISGNFEQLEKNHPVATVQEFGAFTQALSSYIELVVKEGDDTVRKVEHALTSNMGEVELQVLQEMIPVLGKVLGQPPTKRVIIERQSTADEGAQSILKGADTKDRLIRILILFLSTIRSLGRPVILFLDDVQWANQSALKMMTRLLDYGDDSSIIPPMMLLCTCRNNEVTEDHPLITTLRDIDNRVVRTDVQVSDMTVDEVNQVVSSVFRIPLSESRSLSEVLFRHTEGNTLFLIELIKSLCDEKVLSFKQGRWTWDVDDVDVAASRDIFELIEKKVHRLDSKAQELLKVAACFGSTFSSVALSYTSTLPKEEMDDAICDMQSNGLILFDSSSGIGRFAHDKVQQTVYQLTPESSMDEVHLRIGRELKTSMPKEVLDENILLVAHQISLGIHLLEDANEKQEIAEFFFEAGQKAALASSFLSAASFLNLAIRLLNRSHWREQYSLSLRFYSFAAELEFYSGNTERVDYLVNAVIYHAKSFDDSLVARFTRLYSLGSRGSYSQGMVESLDMMRCLGEKMPLKPGILHIVFGLVRSNRLLRGKTDDHILNLPAMRNNKKQVVMRLLIFSTIFAFHASREHLPLIAFRLVEITVRDGVCGMGKSARKNSLLPNCLCLRGEHLLKRVFFSHLRRRTI